MVRQEPEEGEEGLMTVEQVSPGVYVVHSRSGGDYTVFYNPRLKAFVCTCPHYAYRMTPCKHALYVAVLLREGRL
jgi:hypothetical protein